MLISLAVAFVITPWLAVRWLPRHQPHAAEAVADLCYKAAPFSPIQECVLECTVWVTLVQG